MQWEPESILAFPNAHGEFHDKLIDDNTSLPRMAIARLDKRVHAVVICDPTPINPWYAAELEAFQRGVFDAAKDLTDGKKVLFLCEGGKNRSRAAAIAAARLAKFDAAALPLPEDVSLMQVVDSVWSLVTPPPLLHSPHSFLAARSARDRPLRCQEIGHEKRKR